MRASSIKAGAARIFSAQSGQQLDGRPGAEATEQGAGQDVAGVMHAKHHPGDPDQRRPTVSQGRELGVAMADQTGHQEGSRCVAGGHTELVMGLNRTLKVRHLYKRPVTPDQFLQGHESRQFEAESQQSRLDETGAVDISKQEYGDCQYRIQLAIARMGDQSGQSDQRGGLLPSVEPQTGCGIELEQAIAHDTSPIGILNGHTIIRWCVSLVKAA